MIIVNYSAGQLANRLQHFSHFISNGIAQNHKLIYPFFDEYKGFFEATDLDNFPSKNISIHFSKIIFVNFLIKKLIPRVRHLYFLNKWFFLNIIEFHNIRESDISNIKFDLNNPNFKIKAKSKILFTEGWLYWDQINFYKHQDDIRRIFTPIRKYQDEISVLINRCKEQAEIIVGVHIRRGDYVTFNNGLWYYSDAVYAEKMKEMEGFISRENKKCVFLICSNEIIDQSNFQDFKVINQPNHPIVDLYALAQCNYIMGPPSTFSKWAAYYGKVPLFFMDTPQKIISLENFTKAY